MLPTPLHIDTQLHMSKPPHAGHGHGSLNGSLDIGRLHRYQKLDHPYQLQVKRPCDHNTYENGKVRRTTSFGGEPGAALYMAHGAWRMAHGATLEMLKGEHRQKRPQRAPGLFKAYGKPGGGQIPLNRLGL